MLDQAVGRGGELGWQLRRLLVHGRRHAAVHERTLLAGLKRIPGRLQVVENGGSADAKAEGRQDCGEGDEEGDRDQEKAGEA